MHFSAQGSKIKKAQSEQFLIFSPKKAFPVFWEMELFKQTSYISVGNFPVLKKKKKKTEKISHISENGTSCPKLKKLLFFF